MYVILPYLYQQTISHPYPMVSLVAHYNWPPGAPEVDFQGQERPVTWDDFLFDPRLTKMRKTDLKISENNERSPEIT